MTETPAGKRLHVLKAVEDGWGAFTRAPWPFVLFALLYGVLAMLFQLLPEFLRISQRPVNQMKPTTPSTAINT